MKNNKFTIILLSFFVIISLSKKSISLELSGAWFECEFSGKTTAPSDNCEMLDNDGFIFSNNEATHVRVIESKEKKCKKNKIGQCFLYSEKIIKIKKGRKDIIKFINNKLNLNFLGCTQTYHLKNFENYTSASPDNKKCFWAGKKIFYLKKYHGKMLIK